MSLTLTDFFFNTPIYTKITVTPENTEFLRQVFGERNIDFDGYNPITKQESTFKITTNRLFRDDYYLENGGFTNLEAQCKRSDNTFHFYILWTPENNTLMKVGQYPSVADFHISEIKQYSKLLTKEKLKEFTRAIGLAANGVGIGSFVYLRRIFEFLILDAFKIAKSDDKINDEDFKAARMDEKIGLLQEYLPDFLTANKTMYSILSQGVHSLDEQTCLEHFDTLRVGIEIMLDEKLEKQKKLEKTELAQKKIADLKSKLKK
jgi:hypothetical protein